MQSRSRLPTTLRGYGVRRWRESLSELVDGTPEPNLFPTATIQSGSGAFAPTP